MKPLAYERKSQFFYLMLDPVRVFPGLLDGQGSLEALGQHGKRQDDPVRELLGHKTLQMTLHCAHLSPAHNRDAIQMIDKALGQVGGS